MLNYTYQLKLHIIQRQEPLSALRNFISLVPYQA